MAKSIVADHIRWVSSLEDAKAQAKAAGKLVLLDFFNPG